MPADSANRGRTQHREFYRTVAEIGKQRPDVNRRLRAISATKASKLSSNAEGAGYGGRVS